MDIFCFVPVQVLLNVPFLFPFLPIQRSCCCCFSIRTMFILPLVCGMDLMDFSFSLFECVCVGVSDHSIHLSPKSSEFFLLLLPFLFWMHTSTREAHTYVPESHSTSVYTTARIREWSSNKTLIPSHPNSLESFPSLYISFPWISCSTLLDIHNVILDPRSFFASKNGKKMEKK